MKYPNFICIGLQKCGTTSLYHYLNDHPQVIPNNYKKEVKFWNYVYHKGIEWYKSCFPNKDGKITGDITSNYFWYVDPKIMYKDLPKTTKLITIFRNPIDRMYSFYWWLKRYPCEKHPITDNFWKSHKVFLDESDYKKYLEKWVNIFGWERIHVIILEELIKYPQKVWNELCNYLEIKETLHPYLKQKYLPMNDIEKITLNYYFFNKNVEFFKYIKKENLWIKNM